MSALFKFNFSPKKEIETAQPTSEKIQKEITLSDETFYLLRNLIYHRSGMYFPESKKALLETRVAKRLEELPVPNFEEYAKYIQKKENQEEIIALLDAVTINETYFFRANQQFDAIYKLVIPDIIKNKLDLQKVVRIWSAATSTGEEAYTLAILILEHLQPKYPDYTFQILASDINTNVLEVAKKGIYKEYSIKNMEPQYISKYFDISGSNYILKENVKKMVKFAQINLYDTDVVRSLKGVDLIICANVLIYFDLDSKKKVVSNLYDILNTNGYLFIGYSESLHGISKAFSLVHLPKALAYKKV
ncbi:MAG: CheR family methyltransferase [Candidatus Kapaibacteriota bacterium]